MAREPQRMFETAPHRDRRRRIVNTTPNLARPRLDTRPEPTGCRGMASAAAIALTVYGFAMVAWAVFHSHP